MATPSVMRSREPIFSGSIRPRLLSYEDMRSSLARGRGACEKRRVELTLAGYTIRALSIGGIETCFEVPAFDVLLDIGRCPPGSERRSTLLLTHAHIDHAAGLPYFISMRALVKHPAPRVFCPEPAHPHLSRILESWVEL